MKQIKALVEIVKAIRPAIKKGSFLILFEWVIKICKTLLDILFPLLLLDQLSSGNTIDHKVIFISLLIIVFLTFNYLQSMLGDFADTERKMINNRVLYLLAEKALKVSYKRNEEEEFLERKGGAEFSVRNYKSIDELIQCVSEILCEIVVLLVSGVFFIFQVPFLFVLILLGVIGQTIWNNNLNKKLEPYFHRLFPINRRFEWLSALKLDLGRQKDIRQFEMEDMITGKIGQYNKQTGEIFGEMNDLTYKTGIGVGLLNSFVIYSSYFYNAVKVIQGAVSIGEFLTLGAFIKQLNYILSSIGGRITHGKQLISYLQPLVELLGETPESVGGIELEKLESIEFQNVYFRYSDSEEWVLKDITFEIKQGEKIGIVGLNGAGKSTIVKLLCRFYPPTRGSLLVNGRPVDTYSAESYFSKLSAIFQDYTIFDMSIAENLLMGKKMDKTRLQAAIDVSDLRGKVDKLKDKEETLLGPQTYARGVQLSGGERQRLAIGRAICQDGDVFIFDEPNSSLDPVSEYEAYTKYAEMTKNKTAVYISHKMTTTQFCTKLLVLEDGRVTHFDTPENLLEDENSLYYKLFMHQKSLLK